MSSLDELINRQRRMRDDYERCRLIRFTCRGGGWGDRLKGILAAGAYAMRERRALVVDPSCRLEQVYEPALLDWRPFPCPGPAKEVHCIDRRTCRECVLPGLSSGENYTEVVLATNQDCAGQVARGLSQGWRTPLFDALFRLKPELQRRVDLYQEKHGTPDLVAHVRMGGSYQYQGRPKRNSFEDPPRETGGSNDLSFVTKQVARCVLLFTPVRVFAFGDTPEFILPGAASGAELGQLGHIDKTGPLADARTHLEFYLMRRASVLVAAPSGMSLMAYMTRVNPGQQMVTPENCEFPFTYFTVTAD